MRVDYKSYNRVVAYILVVFAFLFLGKGSDMGDACYDFNQSRGVATSYIKARANRDVLTKHDASKTDKIVVGIYERMVNTFDDNHGSIDVYGGADVQKDKRWRWTSNITYDNNRVLHPPLAKLRAFRI